MGNNCSELNDILFRQIKRLESLSVKDADAMRGEIDRAKTVKGLADTVISNGNLVLRAHDSAYEAGESVVVPQMLIGAGNGR